MLDVGLVQSLTHESVVCCVRFSHDGKYIATGCNRSAQIFDVHTGERAAILVDESVDKEGDLYIRSVCFSPDGRYLATGAEDKLIRVSRCVDVFRLESLIACFRSGISQRGKSEILSQVTNKIFTRLISLKMGAISRPVVETRRSACGILMRASRCSC